MTMMKRLREVKEENEQELDSLRTANYLILLSGGEGDDPEVVDPVAYRSRPDRVFECKTCKRQFSSFQALGGHRASHKKHRIIDDLYKDDSPSKSRVHECPICGLEFAVGQALGGHMRRHRNTIEGFASVVPMAKVNKMESKKFIDLNLPPCDEEGEILFGIKMSTVH